MKINKINGSNYDYIQTEVPLYGSSRLGEWKPNILVKTFPTSGIPTYSCISCPVNLWTIDIGLNNGLFPRKIFKKEYELNDHLGNVHTIVRDRKNADSTAFVISYNDYYPGGMLMPRRNYQDSLYTFGYNGKLKDNDIYGNANAYDFKFREDDPRLIHFWSLDPLRRKYAGWSPYAFAMDRVIDGKDLEGLEWADPKKEAADMADYQKSLSDENQKTSTTDSKKDVKDLVLNTQGQDFIKSYEQGPKGGPALQEYDDKNKYWKQGEAPTGKITIGYGHVVQRGEDYSQGITQDQADALFTTDIKKTIILVDTYVNVQLTQQQFNATVSYVFNVGVNNSLAAGRHFIAKLNNSDFSGAASEMDVNTSGNEYSQGLQNRRTAEQNIFLYGIYENNGQ
ncbi:MAG: lysozyme [Bacteroidia bacterium]